MADQEFNLQISGDASGAVSAAKTAGEAIRSLKIDTSDLSDETKKSLGMLSITRSEIEALGQTTEKAGQKIAYTRDDLKDMGDLLGKSLGVEDAGSLAVGRLGVAAFAASKSIGFFLSTWNDVQSAIKGPINVELHDDVARVLASARAWTEYADARKKVIEAANSPQAMADRESQALDHKLTLLKQVLKAEEEGAQAALGAQKDQMSPAAYAAATAGIKNHFAARETEADEQNSQDQIKIKQKEADRLDAEAKKKQKEADALNITASGVDARGAVQMNAAAAPAMLKEVDENLAMIQRLKDYGLRSIKGTDRSGNKSVAEYEGLGGFAKGIEDEWSFRKKYGYTASIQDAEAIENARKGQAEQMLLAGARDADSQRRREDQHSQLLNEAGVDSGAAEVLRNQIKDMQADAAEQTTVDKGTAALTARTAALNQGNDARSAGDLRAALQVDNSVKDQVTQALQTVGSSNKELHDALINALAQLTNQNQQLTGKIKSMSFGGN